MDQTREEANLGPAAVITIACCCAGAAVLWSLGIWETLSLLAAGDRTVWSKAIVFAGLIVFGDLVGTRISDVPRHNLRQTLQRAAVTAAGGFLLAVNARALIAGVSLLVPQVAVWSLANLLRAMLMYVLGAVFVSGCYTLFIPGYLARKAARENEPETAPAVMAKYTFGRQVVKTWNGIKGRWSVVLANYWYMNLLPWGWLTADLGFGIVSCCINIYTAYKSTSKELDAPFAGRLARRFLPGRRRVAAAGDAPR